MAPLTPHWQQPSHGEIQEVVIGKEGFTSKSISKITVAPFGLFAKMSFPPCTRALDPTYATVQMGRDAHLNLNSDLVYINHSCEPSLILDMASLSILAGPQGLRPGSELTFFYPSTEWTMAQPFACFCGTRSCKGRIAGASAMSAEQLRGMWLNGFIREMLEERDVELRKGHGCGQGAGDNEGLWNGEGDGEWRKRKPVTGGSTLGRKTGEAGAARMGPTSRELSGEMGGDTTSV